MKDERGVAHLDELREIVERLGEIDVGVVARTEHPEHAIETDVEARRLDARRVEGIDPDAAAVDLGADVAVGEDHQSPRVRARSPAHLAAVSSASRTASRS